MENRYISQITLPSGNTYFLKDSSAWDAIRALEGGSYFLGVTTTALKDGETTNPITIGGKSVTAVNGNMVVYGNKEFVWSGESTSGKWIEFGDLSTLGSLAYKDAVTISKGSGVNAITALGTLTNSTSSVSFGAHTYGNALGTGATFKATQPTVTVTPTTTGVGATASGTAVGADGTATVLTGVKVSTQPTITLATGAKAGAGVISVATGISSAAADFSDKDQKTAITGVSATKKKLTTTSVRGVASTDTVHDTPTLNTEKVGSASGWNAGTASNWSFTVSNETLTVGGGNGTAPSLTINDVSVGTGLTAGTQRTFAVAAASATTVATGALSDESETTNVGETVAVDAASSGSANVIGANATLTATVTPSTTNIKATASGTAVAADGTASALTGVKVTAQPTIALSANQSGTGTVTVATGITSATATAPTVTVDSSAMVKAITALGAGTAAAQTITAGNPATVKVAKYDDLDVVVS